MEDPGDPFLRYSLAMELDKEGRHDASLDRFGELMREATPYVPAFFMAAQQLARLGRSTRRGACFAKALSTRGARGNAHAAGEMSEFLASLGELGT